MHTGRPKPGSLLEKNEEAIRQIAMAFPETVEDYPWGHSAFKVQGKKVFLFMSCGEEALNLSVKLPESGFEALLLPFTEPTGYGMGKHGWVSASFGPKDKPPLALIAGWMEESFRAIAPKKMIALLDAGGAAPAESGKRAKKTTARKTAKKPITKAAKKAAKKVAKKTAKKVAKKVAKKTATKKKAVKRATKKKVGRKTKKKSRRKA